MATAIRPRAGTSVSGRVHGVHRGVEMVACAKLCLDCSARCTACILLLARDSRFYGVLCRLCADACEACAEACERFDSDVMRQCAEACRRAAERCGRGRLVDARAS